MDYQISQELAEVLTLTGIWFGVMLWTWVIK